MKIATFLGKSLTDEQLTKLTEHLGFNKMKNNAAVNNEIGKEFGILKQKGHFIRKGTKLATYQAHTPAEYTLIVIRNRHYSLQV